jgi:hypothetical protein
MRLQIFCDSHIRNDVFTPYDVKWYDVFFDMYGSFRPGKHAVLNITGPDAFSAGIHECTSGEMHATAHREGGTKECQE